MSYNISVLEDHPVFRDGLKFMLETNNSSWKVYTCKNKEELFNLLESKEIDIAFMDINLNSDNGIDITKIIKSQYPKLKVIAMSAYDKVEYIEQMIENGTSGYLLKNEDKDEILKAIEVVLSGGSYFSQKILSIMYQEFLQNKNHPDKDNESAKISDREYEVLILLCQGLARKKIADKLHISERTVDKHRENLQIKLNVENPIQLVLYAIRNNLVSID